MSGHKRFRNGAWRLTVDAGKDASGKRIQLHRTVHEPNTRAGARQADVALAALVVEAEGRRGIARSNTTVAEYLEGWIARRSPEWAPSTRDVEPGIVRRHIIPHIGHLRLDELRRRDVVALMATLGDRLAPSSIGGVRRILHRALADAIRLELIDVNPASGVKPPKMPKTKVRPPTDDELDRILAAVTEDPQLATIIRLDAVLGSRRGEISALRWSDIDLDEGAVMVARALSNGGRAEGLVERHTKTDVIHPVAIDDDTIAELRAHRVRRIEQCLAAGVRMDEAGFVFVPDRHPAGERPLRPDAISRRFAEACKRADVTGVRFHDIRHYVASTMLANGVDVRTGAHRLGQHPNTFLGRYSHLIPAADREAAEILARRRKRG